MNFEQYKIASQRIQRDYERKHRRDKLVFQIAVVLILLVLGALLLA